jgi:hypothetical protein
MRFIFTVIGLNAGQKIDRYRSNRVSSPDTEGNWGFVGIL